MLQDLTLIYLGRLIKQVGWFLVIVTFIWMLGLSLIKYLEGMWKRINTKNFEEINSKAIVHIWKYLPYLWTILSVYLGLYIVEAPREYQLIALKIFGVLFALGIVLVTSKFLEMFIYKAVIHSRNDPESKRLAVFLSRLAESIVAVLVGLVVLQNLGIQVGALLGGLGIGGVALAFAAQNIVSDLFGYFIIYFDKPFREGDFVSVGIDKGMVYKIGLRSTRLKALTGDEMIIPNRDITSARVGNYQKVTERRGILKISLSTKTSSKDLRKIPDWVTKKLSNIQDIKLERVNWVTFASTSLGYEIVYLVKTGNYESFMDTQQIVNLAVKELLEEKKIELA